MKKKLLRGKLSLLLVAMFITMTASVPAMAAAASNNGDAVKITLNGKNLLNAVEPAIKNGTTLVPVRMISEELGAQVNWNNEKRTITIKTGDARQIQLSIGSKEAAVTNGAESNAEQMGAAPFIKEGNTMVPLRFLADKLGLEVNWDNTKRTISLVSKVIDKKTADKLQIEDYIIADNTGKEAYICFNTNNTVKKPQIKVLTRNEPVFKGENKVKDDTLGEYRVELLLTDVKASTALRNKLGLETVKIDGDNLLQSIRLAYPPDDSAMVIYLGCKSLPRPDLMVNDSGFYLELVNENIQDGLKVSSKNIESQSEASQVKMSIPQLEGLKDKKIQETINTNLEQRASKFKDETFEGLDEYVKDCKKEGWPIRAYQAITNYRVTYSNNDILSLYVDYYKYTGGAHGGTDRVQSNIDLKTGKELQLKDLFKSGADYKGIINKEIQKQMQLDPDRYFGSALTGWQGISEAQPYYIEDGNLIIYFGQYEIAPYSAGIPEFKIPLANGPLGELNLKLSNQPQ